MREKVFRNSSGSGFNVSFVDCTSVFVKSVLETVKFHLYIVNYNGKKERECFFCYLVSVALVLYFRVTKHGKNKPVLTCSLF